MTAKAVLYIDLDNTLIDNTPINGASEFEGEWVKFGTDDYPDWPAVTDYLLAEQIGTK
jgi:5'-nucleotidase